MNDASAIPASLAEVKALFTQRGLWQSWLDVESALAEVQAELRVIPAEAAAEIRRRARVEGLDADRLGEDMRRTRAPIVSLVRALAQACEGDAGGYVHWGATTQNVMQTGRTLLMKRAHRASMGRFADVLDKLAGLAEEGAGTLMAGRTNQRHALPITFGFKVAGWIEEMLRHHARLAGAESRVFLSQWGGAVGAMHAFGEHGPEINRRLSHRLGLLPMAVPSRAATDQFAEYVMLLALLGTTCAKIARELYSLMADEFAEVFEDLGDEVIGSSTMPQKVNPKVSVQVIALAARLRSQVPLALEAMQPTREGDAANNLMVSALVDTVCPLAYELVATMDDLLGCVRLDPGRMRANLDASGPFIVAENAMMVLAPAIGRTRAHDLLHHAVAQALREGGDLADLLLKDETVARSIGESTLRACLDPAAYTGHSRAMALEQAAAARRGAAQVRSAVAPGPGQ